MLDISVVIPTRNRPGFLGRCLASLCAQTLDAARFEICVVNNGDIEIPTKIVALVNFHYPTHRVFLVDEPKLGTANARNRGVAQTTAPLVAHSDDDATMPSDWLENLIAGFVVQPAKTGKIGGAVSPVWTVPRPDWLSDAMLVLLAAIMPPELQAGLTDQALPMTNVCYRREALMESGGFPATLGRKGNSLLGDEQAVDLVLHSKGWQLFYDPALIVEHAMPAERLAPVWLRRAAFWQGVSDYARGIYLQKHGIAVSQIPIEMPLSHENWGFINNSAEIPTDDGLRRLRGLGFTLASSGFIPTR